MSLRRRALEALLDITDRGAYANLRLKEAQQGLSEQDAKWVAAAVYGTLDHLLYIDYMLAHFTKGTQKPVVRGILRMGACELLFMRSGPAAAVNESVNLAKEVGKGALSGYVNGVLRALDRSRNELPPLPQDPAGRLSVLYSWPLWLVQEWLERFGEEEAEALLSAPPQPMTLRAQPPYTLEELAETLASRGTAFTKGALAEDCVKLAAGYDIAGDPLYRNGGVAVQSESAMLVCRACGVRPGMRVLDACAAPGGKTAYLYALCPETRLTAWELHPHRKKLLDSTLTRLRVPAETAERDAGEPDPALYGAFDAVLLDVPCSGLGVAGGKPDIRYAKSREGVASLRETQRRILDTCAEYVRPGGTLVYASCTISRTENEAQVEAFLKRRTDFAPASLEPFLPGNLPGLCTGMVQLLPHRDGTEGFFIARMERKQ